MFHMPLSLITNVQINDHNRLKVNVVPHVWGSAVGLAAGLHAVATLPCLLIPPSRFWIVTSDTSRMLKP